MSIGPSQTLGLRRGAATRVYRAKHVQTLGLRRGAATRVYRASIGGCNACLSGSSGAATRVYRAHLSGFYRALSGQTLGLRRGAATRVYRALSGPCGAATRVYRASYRASTSRSNASSFALDGLVNPQIFLTNWRDASRISVSVAGGSKLNSVLMFLHMTALLSPVGQGNLAVTTDEPCPAPGDFTECHCALVRSA